MNCMTFPRSGACILYLGVKRCDRSALRLHCKMQIMCLPLYLKQPTAVIETAMVAVILTVLSSAKERQMGAKRIKNWICMGAMIVSSL